ncbi:pilus assembly protein [Cedecea sp.]|jgi:pilus assembly protein HofM|uniref:pilus assembly protein n=1 Tax=Cedecea sp. TaxID=1970739 RepID=UPI0012AD328B|nr:pilus assembly protein [Enterobacteriaceae bacterium RIT693]
MMFPGWRIGLDIQAEGVRAAAVQWHRQGWQLRHWWFLPFPEQVLADGMLPEPGTLRETLAKWRKEIPERHQLRVGFPVQRTLQRQIPRPDRRLQESAQEKYIAGATARQLQIPTAQLCYDYPDEGEPLCVTAAKQEDLGALLANLASVKLFPRTVTPGDKILSALPQSCYSAGCRFLVHEEGGYWLWASVNNPERSGWLDKRQAIDFPALCQQLGACASEIAVSQANGDGTIPAGAETLNAWQPIVRHQPPLPRHGGLYTLALGLALGPIR